MLTATHTNVQSMTMAKTELGDRLIDIRLNDGTS